MKKLLYSFAVCLTLLVSCGLVVTGCRSQPKKTATSEDGPKLTQGMVDRIVKGETTSQQVEELVGAKAQETKEMDDGRTLWVFAWSRATADEQGNVLEMQLHVLKVFFRDGVVDETDYAETKQ